MSKNVAYVVTVGRTPGIYESWKECQEQVLRYHDARFRGFEQYEDAIKAWEAFEQESGYGTSSYEEEPVSPKERDALVLAGQLCPYCWGKTVCVDSAEVYNGRSYGPIWICRPCRAWVGCHKGTTKPLGRLADAELRSWKQKFHAAFDPVWKSGDMGRSRLYGWLADRMEISAEVCHGGMFTIEQCKQAIDIVGGLRRKSVKHVPQKAVRVDPHPAIVRRARALVTSPFGSNTTTCTATSCSFPRCECGLNK